LTRAIRPAEARPEEEGMTPKIGLKDADRTAVVDILNTTLADEVVLYVKTRNYHWNVMGSDFSELHKFFEEQYDKIEDFMDDTAERARALGGHALGTLAEFLKRTRLKESPGKYPGQEAMVADLLADHESIIQGLRTDLEACQSKHGDAGTADYLTGLMEEHEKMAWMLRSYLA
jgi:starvation-inducible DNA-binding protein